MLRFVAVCLPVIAFAQPAFADCSAAETTVATKECLATSLAQSTKELEQAEAEMARRATNIDEDSAREYRVSEKFALSQETFKAHVEADCAYEESVYTNGSFAGIAYAACKQAHLSNRLEKFKSELAQ